MKVVQQALSILPRRAKRSQRRRKLRNQRRQHQYQPLARNMHITILRRRRIKKRQAAKLPMTIIPPHLLTMNMKLIMLAMMRTPMRSNQKKELTTAIIILKKKLTTAIIILPVQTTIMMTYRNPLKMMVTRQTRSLMISLKM